MKETKMLVPRGLERLRIDAASAILISRTHFLPGRHVAALGPTLLLFLSLNASHAQEPLDNMAHE